MLGKWILMWYCYTSSFNNVDCVDIAGVVVIENKKVATYIYPYEYVEWEVVKEEKIIVTNDELEYGIFYLKHNEYISSILIITPTTIQQVILVPTIDHVDHILLLRKP